MDKIISINNNQLNDYLDYIMQRMDIIKKDNVILNNQDIFLIENYRKIVKNKSVNGYLTVHNKQIYTALKAIKNMETGSETLDLLDQMLYIYLVNKYHDKFLNTDIKFQKDLISALLNCGVNYTRYDNFIPSLLNPKHISTYLEMDVGYDNKFHLLESIIEEITSDNIKENEKIINAYLQTNEMERSDTSLLEEFTLENLLDFIKSQIETADKLGIPIFTEDYNPDVLKKIKLLPKEDQDAFLQIAKDIYYDKIGINYKVGAILALGNNMTNVLNNKIVDITRKTR